LTVAAVGNRRSTVAYCRCCRLLLHSRQSPVDLLFPAVATVNRLSKVLTVIQSTVAYCWQQYPTVVSSSSPLRCHQPQQQAVAVAVVCLANRYIVWRIYSCDEGVCVDCSTHAVSLDIFARRGCMYGSYVSPTLSSATVRRGCM